MGSILSLDEYRGYPSGAHDDSAKHLVWLALRQRSAHTARIAVAASRSGEKPTMPFSAILPSKEFLACSAIQCRPRKRATATGGPWWPCRPRRRRSGDTRTPHDPGLHGTRAQCMDLTERPPMARLKPGTSPQEQVGAALRLPDEGAHVAALGRVLLGFEAARPHEDDLPWRERKGLATGRAAANRPRGRGRAGGGFQLGAPAPASA
jgi:hypothetical protein